jgi:predicted DNA-binding transcriptional regulator AlpA
MDNATPSHHPATDADLQPWMRLEDVCKLLGGISKKTAYSWMSARGLPVGRSLAGGRIVLYEREKITNWIASQPMSDAGRLGKTGLSRTEAARQQSAARSSRSSAQSVAGAA